MQGWFILLILLCLRSHLHERLLHGIESGSLDHDFFLCGQKRDLAFGFDDALVKPAQLPIFIRGIYYEGWNPAQAPSKDRKKEAFLFRILSEFAHTRNPDVDAAHVARAIFRVLSRHISEGELEQVRTQLPHEVRELWPESTAA